MTIPSSSQGVSVAGLVRSGIELSDGMVVGGSMILLGGKTFLWGVDRLRHSPSQSTTAAIGGLDGQTQGEWDWRWVGWNEEMFKVLEVCGPRPEMLIFGTGKTVLPAPPFLRNYLNGLGIQLDIMNTRDACSTYNMLAEEGRLVAAALLSVNPPPASTRSAADEFSVLAGAFRSGSGEGGRRPVDV
ncbi:Uncharacterized conserved nuclear protein [Phaffia rhodozyma]|uniref:Uncharacterized conserved nuclear protein n=1 Tax=Phaffia rhodozyma TaxID=264483 RepID=A0A0F7SE95_PHARH|nr:Uncharacterized conserved nuclear protein [Phaffia rhodozyma]